MWIFIVNPISGKGKADGIAAFAEKHLRAAGVDFSIVKTTHAGHAIELAKSFRDKADVVVAVGGDGTINEVGGSLLNCERTALGIIPCGSGNGLARSLKIPLKMGAALRHLLGAQIKTMDTGKMNEKTFLCVCGFGFDAVTAHKFSTAGKRGKGTYVRVVSRELFGYQPEAVKFEAGGKVHEEKAFMLSVANGPQFGNNIFINPTANMFDGKLNLTLVKPFPRWRIAPILTAMRLGRTHRLREFMQFSDEKFIVHPASPWAHIDGEPVEISGPQEIKVLPASLKILC